MCVSLLVGMSGSWHMPELKGVKSSSEKKKKKKCNGLVSQL